MDMASDYSPIQRKSLYFFLCGGKVRGHIFLSKLRFIAEILENLAIGFDFIGIRTEIWLLTINANAIILCLYRRPLKEMVRWHTLKKIIWYKNERKSYATDSR